MKILAFIDAFRPPDYEGNVGGGEISNRILLQGLARCGHAVCVVTRHGTGVWGDDIGGVKVYDLSAFSPAGFLRKPLALILYQRMAFRIANLFGPDIIIANTASTAIGAVARRRFNVPVGAFVRAFENFDDFYLKERSLRDCLRDILRRVTIGNSRGQALDLVDFLLPCSKFMAKLCRKEFKSPRMYVVYPPLDFSIQPLQFTKEIRNVYMVGTSTKKGASIFRELAQRFPALQFFIAGDSSLPLGKSVSKGNLTARGWVGDRISFLNDADLVLVPSLWEEPFGRIAIEALAAGKIVIVSDTGGLPEAVAYQEFLIVPPGDIDAWQARLKQVLDSPELFMESCQAAREQLQAFTAEMQVNALAKAFMEELHYASGR